jgi:hypothetical protein
MMKSFASSAGENSPAPLSIGRRARRALALTVALTLPLQNIAWAVCSNGTSFPAGGFVVGSAALPVAANWSPGVFTGTAGSLFIPDTSVFEHNDPTQPLTGGGHNWVFDQGSTLCKETDIGAAGAVATGWSIPPNSPTDCVVLPIVQGGVFRNLGDIPYQGDVITPTCDPTALSAPGLPNSRNTYFNQLGCSISASHNGGVPVATTPQTATSYLFVAGIKGGLFSISLDNVTTPVVGGDAGKTVGPLNYYSTIPEGQKLTNAIVSKDGQFALATSDKGGTYIYGCFNPLGDPGDPKLPLNPNFFVPPGPTVQCMQVGNNALQRDLTDSFGPDNQPYFGGQRVVNSFDVVPGGTARSAWPQCIFDQNGSLSIADAFAHNRTNGCGNATSNFGFVSALITQPQAMISHTGTPYMYVGPIGGTVVQFKVGVDPISGLSTYKFRTYGTGFSLITGLGVADDLQSLMVFSDPSAIGLAGQEVVTKVPLCEDM